MKYNRVPVKGFEGYEIDSEGTVWTCHKKARAKNDPSLWKPLKSLGSRGNYLNVGLYIDGKQERKVIHRLVAEAFVINPDNKPFACHKDGNARNNKASNLYWGTALENQQDRMKHGTQSKGESNGKTILTEKQVRVIKWGLHYGAAHKHLAKMCGVALSNISHIASGRTWSHINIY